MIIWRFLIKLKYEGPHIHSADQEPVYSFGRKYPQLKWINWCDNQFADFYFELKDQTFSSWDALKYFRSLDWVKEMVQETCIYSIEMEPLLSRIEIYKKKEN